jgi:hypothetical protein
MFNVRLLLLIFGVAQAVLYSSLLPLWEGFDEPWHYGYVQRLATGGGLPVLGKTSLSKELWASMLICPVSHVVHSALPELQPFDAYFRLSPEARAQERNALETLPRDGAVSTTHINYEIQQAPLAYAVLAIPGFLLRNVALPARILWLRIFNAVLCAAATFLAAEYLFRRLDLPEAWRALGIFCIFACQMYWATSAHIASDGIALALSIWYFGALAAFFKQPGLPMAWRLGLISALGLLAKAYFLPLTALAAGIAALNNIRTLPAFAAIPLALAGPWYARNLPEPSRHIALENRLGPHPAVHVARHPLDRQQLLHQLRHRNAELASRTPGGGPTAIRPPTETSRVGSPRGGRDPRRRHTLCCRKRRDLSAWDVRRARPLVQRTPSHPRAGSVAARDEPLAAHRPPFSDRHVPDLDVRLYRHLYR